MKKTSIIIVLFVMFLIASLVGACSAEAPSEADIQTAIAQTAEAAPADTDAETNLPAPTEADEPAAPATDIPEPTDTAEPTNTAVPTDTPEPTATTEPTAVPTETPVPTPTPLPVGLGRAQPFGSGEIVDGESWQIQVLETMRGDEAWQKIIAANQFNDPPPEGMEYLLVNVHATNIAAGDEALRISGSDFDVTGNNNILYKQEYVSGPDPELDGELFTGGETEGWIAFLIGEGEENLILILDELFSFDESEQRFVALEEGASALVDQGLYDIGATSTGLTRSEPVAIGETVATDEFELTITEVMRGDDVYTMLIAENQFNDPPEEGMTLLAAKIHARRIGTSDRAQDISYTEFDSTGSENILYRLPSAVVPDELDSSLFPGGETEGWIVMQVRDGEENLMLVYEPLFSFTDEELRFLALDEGASITVPEELSSVSDNGVGTDKSEPAQLGETVNTGSFEFTVTDVIRGNEALTMTQQANQFNDPPDDGMEYVAVNMNVRRVDSNDDWVDISGSAFDLTGDNGVIYDTPSVVEPDPKFDARLYPDGEYEGWTIYQAAEGEGGLVLIYDTLLGISERFFALE